MKKLWISAMMIGLVVSSSTLSFAQSFQPGAATPLGYAQVKSKAAAPNELSAVEKKIYNANYFVYNNLLAQSESDFIKRVQAAVKAKEAFITVKCDGFKFSMALLDRAIGAARYYGSYRYSVDPDTNIVIISDLVY